MTSPDRQDLLSFYQKILEVRKQENIELAISPITSSLGLPLLLYTQLPKEEQAKIFRERYGIEIEPEEIKDVQPDAVNNEDRAKDVGAD